MKLSIITCTYNSEKYLQECIDSVIAQNLNLENYEHIFVDAYSTDKTKEIIREYMKKYSNVKLIERKPKGVYNAMNEGIKEASGEYILCLNSDDWLEPNVLNGYLQFIEETCYKDLYYAKVNAIVDGKISYTIPNKFLWLRKFLFKYFGSNVLIYHPTVIIKKNTIFELGLFDEFKKITSDYGMWLNIMRNKKKCMYYNEVTTNFRIHDGGISSNKKNQALCEAEFAYFQKKYLPRYTRFMLSPIHLAGKIKKALLSLLR